MTEATDELEQQGSEPTQAGEGGGSAVSNSGEPAQPKKPSDQILREEISEGVTALKRPSMGLFISGLSAGLELGFSLLLMATLRQRMQHQLQPAVAELLTAIMYSVGFIFVTVGRSELFTEHTTLAVLPVVAGRKTIGDLLRLWGLVYASNLIGASAFAYVTSLVAPAMDLAEHQTLGEIARPIVHHPWHVMIFSGILAGWLMGLLSWLVTASRDTISQIAIVMLVAGAIGLLHLDHCIAGTVEVLSGAFAGQGVSATDYFRFLGCATVGNAIGGTFLVMLIKYSHATRMNPSGD